MIEELFFKNCGDTLPFTCFLVLFTMYIPETTFLFIYVTTYVCLFFENVQLHETEGAETGCS